MTPSQLISQIVADHGSCHALGTEAYSAESDRRHCRNRWYRWAVNPYPATLGKLDADLQRLGMKLELSVSPLDSGVSGQNTMEKGDELPRRSNQ